MLKIKPTPHLFIKLQVRISKICPLTLIGKQKRILIGKMGKKTHHQTHLQASGNAGYQF
jgi:hypothetical protein